VCAAALAPGAPPGGTLIVDARRLRGAAADFYEAYPRLQAAMLAGLRPGGGEEEGSAGGPAPQPSTTADATTASATAAMAAAAAAWQEEDSEDEALSPRRSRVVTADSVEAALPEL
jgi:hypothetical protein